MPLHIKTLVVILAIATFIFYFSKKHLEYLLEPGEFEKWRNTWLGVTGIAFLAGNFWLYIIASAVFVRYMVKPLENRFALYSAILVAIPVISVRIPKLIDISYPIMLAIVVLLPMFLIKKYRPNAPKLGATTADKIGLVLLVLMVILEMRSRTFTDALRSGLGYFLTWFLPYFIASRAMHDFKQLRNVLIGFALGGIIAGSIAFFEFLTHWLLYGPLANALKTPFVLGAYLGRGDSIRTMASLGHPLVLGFFMVIVTGFYLFIAPYIKNKRVRLIGFLLVAAGIIAPISRGPWLCAVILGFIFIMTGPNVVKRLMIVFLLTAVTAPALPFIPGGQKIINMLPFVGNVDQFNVDYRVVLVDRALMIIKRKPLFGVSDVPAQPEMHDMVQGEGIVDVVNSYLNFALGYGIPAMILFVSFFLNAIFRVNKSRKKIKDKLSHEYRCGRCLLATMIAMLIGLASASSIGVLFTVVFILAGIMQSYSRIIDNTYKKPSWR